MAAATENENVLNIPNSSEIFDPDDVIPRHSPLMQPLCPKLKPSPSPSPDIPAAQIRSSLGDTVLLWSLDSRRRPELSQAVASQSLPPIITDEGHCDNAQQFLQNSRVRPSRASGSMSPCAPVCDAAVLLSSGHQAKLMQRAMSEEKTCNLGCTHHLHFKKQQWRQQIATHSPKGIQKAVAESSIDPVACSAIFKAESGGLPPLQLDFPRPELSSQILPSIRSTLGDINHIPSDNPADTEKGAFPRQAAGATSLLLRSPGSQPFTPFLPGSQLSPPISPHSAPIQGLPSPHSLSSWGPFGQSSRSGSGCWPKTEGLLSSLGGQEFFDPAYTMPLPTVPATNRIKFTSIMEPHVGGFVCSYSGCNAHPFQTQYLLNSHANVHSSARPHYCPIEGCPRSEGGKGFKRKNEMLRHGLVHDSPGYVCPFCSDREHKYPRPDNLQRHVRVHHIDKDKDDLMLQEVLSQRAYGPRRGRRKRMAPT